jgi:probable DNA metabolism protein
MTEPINENSNEAAETILICEDSIEGILTGVYEAYELRRPHHTIRLQIGEEQNLRLFCVYHKVQPNEEKSSKVMRTIYRRFGEDAYTQICQALVSYDMEKADAVYHTIVTGISGSYRGNLMDHLSNRYVHKVFQLSRNTGIEIHHLLGFLRFKELQNGILLARYHPKNDVMALLMPHFADRLPGEDFAIYDEGRKYYAVHPKGKQWYFVRGELPFAQEQEIYTKQEAEYQMLYRHFCSSIAIAERKNLDLQRNMLPFRFRKYMTEFVQID